MEGELSHVGFMSSSCIHVIGFSDLVDYWVIKIKKAHDPLRT